MFLFLGSWRSTVITGLTLPIAVIATFISLRVFGFTLNYMTMMALSLTIGLLIDDAIVVRENIVRHIHMGKDHYTAAREGTDEIGLAVLATTFSIVAVFVPIAFMGGIVGKFFYPFGITVAVAVLVSLFVSFTLDPMLSAVWRDPPRGMHDARFVGPVLRGFDRFMNRVHAIYGRLLGWVLSQRQWTLGTTVPKLNVPIGVPSIGVWRAAHAGRTSSEAALCNDQPARNYVVDRGAEFCARDSDRRCRGHRDDAGERRELYQRSVDDAGRLQPRIRRRARQSASNRRCANSRRSIRSIPALAPRARRTPAGLI